MAAEAAQQRRLGEAVRTRREGLGMSIPVAASRAKIDRETWRNLEAGKRELRSYLHVKVEKALGWKTGSIDVIRNGGEPELLTTSPPSDEESTYYHPELGEITHEQDVQLWEATTFDEDTRVGFIFQARAKRMREETEHEPGRRAAG